MPRPAPRPRAGAFLLALALVAAPAAPAAADVVDRVVLRVNDTIATLLDYERRRAELVSQVQSADLTEEQRAEAMAGLGNRLFRDMLEELLLLSRADQLRVHPSEEEVDRAVRGVRQDFGIATDDEFAAALSSQGLSLAEFREQIRNQLRMRDVVTREVTSAIELEEDDLRRAYRADQDRYRLAERFRVREFVVLEAETVDRGELQRIAEAIHDEIEAGRGVEEIAKVYAERGLTSDLIDLGWVETGELDPGLEAALSSLSPGDVSRPVPGRGGLHILELLEREEARVREFGEVAEEIAAEERQRLYMEKIGEYMRKLEESAYVRAEPPPEAAGFRTVAGSRTRDDPFADFEPEEGEVPAEIEEPAEPEVTPPEDRPEPEVTEPPPPSSPTPDRSPER
jgi:peptidyl-prolyl cis-trans isomerase SurA